MKGTEKGSPLKNQTMSNFKTMAEWQKYLKQVIAINQIYNEKQGNKRKKSAKPTRQQNLQG